MTGPESGVDTLTKEQKLSPEERDSSFVFRHVAMDAAMRAIGDTKEEDYERKMAELRSSGKTPEQALMGLGHILRPAKNDRETTTPVYDRKGEKPIYIGFDAATGVWVAPGPGKPKDKVYQINSVCRGMDGSVSVTVVKRDDRGNETLEALPPIPSDVFAETYLINLAGELGVSGSVVNWSHLTSDAQLQTFMQQHLEHRRDAGKPLPTELASKKDQAEKEAGVVKKDVAEVWITKLKGSFKDKIPPDNPGPQGDATKQQIYAEWQTLTDAKKQWYIGLVSLESRVQVSGDKLESGLLADIFLHADDTDYDQQLSAIGKEIDTLQSRITKLEKGSEIYSRLQHKLEDSIAREEAIAQVKAKRRECTEHITRELQAGTLALSADGAQVVDSLKKAIAGVGDVRANLQATMETIDKANVNIELEKMTSTLPEEERSYWKTMLEQWGPKFAFVFLLLLQQSIGQMGKSAV